MLKIKLITRIDARIAAEMAALQQHLLKGKSGRPLDVQLFRDCVDTGFLIGAWIEDCMHVPGADPVNQSDLAGMCFVYIQQTISRRVMGYEELVVDPKFRGLHIADKIDEFLIALAREHDCDCIEGIMPVGNEPVKKVHERNGFIVRVQLPFRIILNQF